MRVNDNVQRLLSQNKSVHCDMKELRGQVVGYREGNDKPVILLVEGKRKAVNFDSMNCAIFRKKGKYYISSI